MKKINIKEKLSQIECPLSTLSLGDFDQIGEFTAKKARSPNDSLYKTAGCYFRPNYERGLLVYSLIKRFEIRSFFEIGFGRGYASFCAAKAMTDMGWDDGKVYSVDPNIDENHLKNISQIFPKEWFQKINLIKGNVNDALTMVAGPFDMVYIDGDHRYEGVKNDWECMKDRFNKFLLFDDYGVEEKGDIQVKRLVDEINDEKELIITDRRIFFDDRKILDEDVNYGQVLIKNKNFDVTSFLSEW